MADLPLHFQTAKVFMELLEIYLGIGLDQDMVKIYTKEKMDFSLRLLAVWHTFLATPSKSPFFRYLRLLVNILLTIEERCEMAFCSNPGGSLYLKLRKSIVSKTKKDNQ